jgi:DnaJ-class molecular chaperone
MQDHYQTLGVARTATDDEIKRAYRRLASKHHPDKGGDTQAFQKIEEAYRVLSDPAQRQQYDNPGIKININGGGFQGAPFDFDSIFEMFGARMHQKPSASRQSQRATIWIPLEVAAAGGNRLISVNTNLGTQTLEIDIPQGVHDNENIRYANLGPGNTDLVINFRVQPHPQCTRNGLDLYVERSLDFWQLILGTTIKVIDIFRNELELVVPPRTKPGSMLRARGRGLKRSGHSNGDLFIRISAAMPDHIPDEIVKILEQKRANK